MKSWPDVPSSGELCVRGTTEWRPSKSSFVKTTPVLDTLCLIPLLVTIRTHNNSLNNASKSTLPSYLPE